MAQSPATQWPMTNIFNPWPVYTDGESNVIAVKIADILPQTDGSVTILLEGDYDPVYEPQIFVTTFKPAVGGYLVRDSGNQDLYISATTFESEYTEVPRGTPGKDGIDAASWANYSLTGNMPVNYPDNPSSTGAHGSIGTALYWKITVTCSEAPLGTVSVAHEAALAKSPGVPCDADGNALPFSIVTNQISGSATVYPKIEIYLFVSGAATQLWNMSTKAMTALSLVAGDGGYDPHYHCSYWYKTAL